MSRTRGRPKQKRRWHAGSKMKIQKIKGDRPEKRREERKETGKERDRQRKRDGPEKQILI
jgi:hypothetical protein